MAGRWKKVRTQAELEQVVAAGDFAEIVGDGYFSATGSATVHAYDSATVRATGSATVHAYDSATVRATGSATVHAYGSATVRATGSATVHAYDSATVRATGSATVHATGSATVRATGSATVHAYDSATVHATGSATVHAYGSATVHAYDSATVHAYDSATVHAYDSATVHATGSATVRATGSATVHAYDSATVHATGSATVRATGWIPIHKLSKRVRITGGQVIEPPDLTIAEHWLAYYGLEPDSAGVVVLYKAVKENWHSDHGADYSPGATPVADDFEPTNACGAGLHFSPRPFAALNYSAGPKFVACPVMASEIVPIGSEYVSDKVKTPRVVAPGCWQVDEDGNRVVESVQAVTA